MNQRQPTRALAAFAAGLDPQTLSSEVREKLGWLLLDYLRVASIGARLPWSEWARGYIAMVALPGASRVLFSSDALNPEHATFMNVTFASSFDGDDTHVGAMLHPGAAAWAAALAVAEHAGASGPEVLAAVVAGYETDDPDRPCDPAEPLQARLPEHRDLRRLRHRGGRRTAPVPRCGRRERIVEAIGLAGGYPSGIAQFYFSGSSAKRIQAAHAAQSGVAAALLAKHGFTGPADILEGAGGFARAYADGWDPALIEDGLGTRFHLMDVLVKSHAAAARVAAGIDGMLALRRQHRFDAADIASMHLGIPRIIQGRLTNKHPADLQAAQMCLPFSVALAAKVGAAAGTDTGARCLRFRGGAAGPQPSRSGGAHHARSRRRGRGREQRALDGGEGERRTA